MKNDNQPTSPAKKKAGGNFPSASYSGLLKRMAKQFGEMLCVSPETGEKLGIWSISSKGAIGLGTRNASEFWILEPIFHKSSEIEVKGLPICDDWESTAEQIASAKKIIEVDKRYLQGALLILADYGINVGSAELIAATERADLIYENAKAQLPPRSSTNSNQDSSGG
jgi:hypothetical protein